jgi:hypothetical protein
MNAYNTNSNGAAIWSAGPLTLTHVTIKNSQTVPQYCGGALLVAGETQINNSRFENNVAGLGAAPFAFDLSQAPKSKSSTLRSSVIKPRIPRAASAARFTSNMGPPWCATVSFFSITRFSAARSRSMTMRS